MARCILRSLPRRPNLVPRCVNWRTVHVLRAHDEKAKTTYADFRNEVLDEAYHRGFEPLSALDDIDDNSLSLVENTDAGSFKRRDMDEHVLAAAVQRDEAVAPL